MTATFAIRTSSRRGLGCAQRSWTHPLIFCLLLAWLGVWGVAGQARACSVPVFRYALERWPSDDYEVFLFAKGELDPNTQAVLDWFKKTLVDAPVPANCRVGVVDPDEELDRYGEFVWKNHKDEPLPRMVVRYPRMARPMNDVWAGPPSIDVAKQMLDSPVRNELARRLIGGQTAVWLLLTCKDEKKNAAAEKVLRETLPKLEEALQLPPQPPVGPTAFGDEPADEEVDPEDVLRIDFSTLTLARDDPKEAMLVRMLLKTEEDLSELVEPMAFPIYGRGRVLFAFVGEGINAENIAEACEFLIGPCSCQVKWQNPGVDLLMTVDWDAAIYRAVVGEGELARLIGQPVPPGTTTQPATQPTTQPAAAPTERAAASGLDSAVVRNTALTLGAVLIVTMLVAIVMRRKSAA